MRRPPPSLALIGKTPCTTHLGFCVLSYVRIEDANFGWIPTGSILFMAIGVHIALEEFVQAQQTIWTFRTKNC